MKPLPRRSTRAKRYKKKRDKKIEVKLTDEENTITRSKYGRQAAEVARRHWLGMHVAHATTPTKRQQLEVAAALHSYRLAVVELRLQVAHAFGDAAAKILQEEETKFNALTHLWLTHFSETQKNEKNQEA